MALSESGVVRGYIFISLERKYVFPEDLETNFPSESTFLIFSFSFAL
jgi:hypothetical protein